jgi:hypothetical protein
MEPNVIEAETAHGKKYGYTRVNSFFAYTHTMEIHVRGFVIMGNFLLHGPAIPLFITNVDAILPICKRHCIPIIGPASRRHKLSILRMDD